MNKWQKIGLAVGMGTAVITTTHLINSIIFKSSTANNYTGKKQLSVEVRQYCIYNCRLRFSTFTYTRS